MGYQCGLCHGHLPNSKPSVCMHCGSRINSYPNDEWIGPAVGAAFFGVIAYLTGWTFRWVIFAVLVIYKISKVD